MKQIRENIGAPVSTLGNVPGMGNAVPAQSVAITGSQQGSPAAMGSGDKWSNFMGPYTQTGVLKKRKKKKTKKTANETFYPSLDIDISEESINPHDKIGTAMAKKMKVPIYFKKRGQGVSQKNVDKVKECVRSIKEALLRDEKGDVKTRNDFGYDQEHFVTFDELGVMLNDAIANKEWDRVRDIQGMIYRMKSITEAIKINGNIYHMLETKEGTVMVGPGGILGDKRVHIPWSVVKQMMEKYA